MSYPELTNVVCELCGSDSLKVVHHVQKYAIVQCGGCALAFAHPRPGGEVLSAIYSDSYFGEGKKDATPFGYTSPYELMANAARDTYNDLLLRIGRYRAPGRLLEVGCAYGFFLGQAAQFNWKVVGVEYNHEAAAFAGHRFGVPVYAGDFLRAPLEGERFDAIVMLDLIEHLPEPIAAIRRCWNLLNNGGILVVRTPDIESQSARSWGARWPQLKPPEHLFFFSKKSLSILFRETSFSPVFWQNVGGLGIASRVVGDRRVLEAIKRNRWIRNLSRTLGSRLNRGDCLVVVARKTPSSGDEA